MTNITPIRKEHANADVVAVAGKVRGLLAEKKIAAYRIPELSKSDASRGYWQRRVSGEIPFDMEDLSIIAGLCHMSLYTLLMTIAPKPGPGGGTLPHLDSNQEPAGLATPALARVTNIRMAHQPESTRKPSSQSPQNAVVTPIRARV